MNDSIRTALEMAAEHRSAKRYKEAEEIYRAIIVTHPGLAEAYFNLGVTLVAAQRWREAADVLTASLPLIHSPAKYQSILMQAVASRVSDNVARSLPLTDMCVNGIGPITAEIELTAHCQLKCPFCRTGGDLRQKYMNVPRGLLARETLIRILESIPSLFYVRLYNWGEPFLHPDLPNLVEIVKKSGRYCEISTNMQIMDPELAERLVRAGLDLIRISCDGVTQETYEQYRKGGSLDKVIEHAGILAAKRRELNSVTPVAIFQMVVNRFNEKEVDAFPAFAREAGADVIDQIGICPMTLEGADMIEAFGARDPRFPHYAPVNPLTGCRQPWSHISLDWNGDVYTCCNPSGLIEYKMGNINQDDFSDIWNNERYRYARRLIASGQIEDNGLKMPCVDMCHSREFANSWYAGAAPLAQSQ